MKNKKNRLLIIISSLILLLIISWSIYYFKNNKNNNWIIELKPDNKDLVLFNKILTEATKVEDYKNCEKIWLEDLKKNCASQIKLRFSVIWTAKNVWECDAINKENEFWTVKYQKDICYLNLISRWITKNILNSKKVCNKIDNKDIKNLCNIQAKNLYETKK